MTLLFAPYYILLRVFWKSFEATMTCPCPGGRVGTKCPVLWTLTLVTLLITWMVPQKAAGSFIQTEVWLKEELLCFEYWYSTIFLISVWNWKYWFDGIFNSSDLSGQKESLFFPSANRIILQFKGQLASATTKPFILVCGIIKILEMSECKTIFLA